MNLGPYQKDKLWIPPDDLEEKANPHMAWETANPLWWCPRGYACVRVDARGSGKSPGRSDPSSYQEGVDFYDAIEWMAKRDWCNGNIGTLGISYHANSQWRVANLNPPSLKAIIPWEGRADLYRDQTFHGGIFAMGFLHTWIATNMAHHLMGKPRTYNPEAFNNNMLWEWASHNLDSEFWRMRSAQLGQDQGADVQRRQLDRRRPASARQHRRLHAGGLRSTRSCASTPARTSIRSTPRKAARSAPVLRSLAEEPRHRHHGRAAREAADPHRRRVEGVQIPLRERMAHRAHASGPRCISS